MINHPSRSNLSYAVAAPVFEDDGPLAIVLGHAKTAQEALTIYAKHFSGTGAVATKAVKATPDRRNEGPVDGWVPVLVDE